MSENKVLSVTVTYFNYSTVLYCTHHGDMVLYSTVIHGDMVTHTVGSTTIQIS